MANAKKTQKIGEFCRADTIFGETYRRCDDGAMENVGRVRTDKQRGMGLAFWAGV